MRNCLFLLLFLAYNTCSALQSHIIAGKVYDALSNKPVANAKVVLWPYHNNRIPPKRAKKIMTNDQGEYSFPVKGPKHYAIKAIFPGYKSDLMVYWPWPSCDTFFTQLKLYPEGVLIHEDTIRIALPRN